MTRDGCYRHPHAEAEFVAMVPTTTGRAVYRLCAGCVTGHPNATALTGRVDRPARKAS